MSDEEESASWEWNIALTLDVFLLSLVFLGVLLSIARFVKSRCGSPPPPPQARDAGSEAESAAQIHHFWGEEPSPSVCQKLIAKFHTRSQEENII